MRLFNHTDYGLIAVRIAAEKAQFGIADVIADGAESEFVLDVENGCSQPLCVFAVGSQQVKRNALCGLLADAWQPFELLDQSR